jgi:hypothetical protein
MKVLILEEKGYVVERPSLGILVLSLEYLTKRCSVVFIAHFIKQSFVGD